MSLANGNGRRFIVDCSEVVAKELRQLQEMASPSERKKIAAAFRTILHKLQTDPNQVGEPLYRLAEMHMQVRIVIIAPLVITFGVVEDKPYVFIKSGSTLNPP